MIQLLYLKLLILMNLFNLDSASAYFIMFHSKFNEVEHHFIWTVFHLLYFLKALFLLLVGFMAELRTEEIIKDSIFMVFHLFPYQIFTVFS